MNIQDIIKAGSFLLAGAGLFAGAPAFAADDDTRVFEPSSEWKVSKKPDRCRLTRSFGSGKNLMRLTIEKGGNEPTFNLTISGKAVANPIGKLISIRFGPDEKVIGRDYITAKTKSGRSVVVMYGADFSPAEPTEDGKYTTDRPDENRLATIEFLEVERAGLKSFRLATGGMAAAMKDLSSCSAALVGALAVSRTGLSREVEPANDRGRWLTSKDYPPLMLGFYQEGEIFFV